MSEQQDFSMASQDSETVTVGNYKLAFNPFAKKSNNVYLPDSWSVKFEFIQHITLFNNVLIVLLGDVGSGKSTFIKQLNEKFDEQITSITLIGTESLSTEKLASKLASDFSLKATTYSNMSSVVEQINSRKKHCLLIIDDAHLLPQSLLKTLLKEIKTQQAHGYFHVLIASNYTVLEYLGSNLEADNESLIHTIELGDFTSDDVKQYIQFMLELAGYVGSFPLSSANFNRLFKLCEGNVGKVKQNMVDFLETSAVAIDNKQSLSVRKKTYLSKISKLAATALPIFIVAVVISHLMPESGLKNATKKTLVLPNKQIKVPEESEPVNSLISKIASFKESSKSNLIEPQQELNERLLMKASQYTIDEFTKNSPVVMDKVIVVPKTLAKIQSSQQLSSKPNFNKTKSKPAIIKTSIKPQSLPTDKKQVTVVNKPHKKQVSKIMPAYSIQIMAAKNLGTLQQFIKKNHLKNQSHIYQFKKAHVTWYILTVGNYQKYQDAKINIKTLPVTLSKYKPWVRKLDKLNLLS